MCALHNTSGTCLPGPGLLSRVTALLGAVGAGAGVVGRHRLKPRSDKNHTLGLVQAVLLPGICDLK